MAELNEKVYNRIILLVLGIPVMFLLLFTIVSIIQLQDINSRIEEGQSQVALDMFIRQALNDSLSESHRQFLTLAALEEESLNERYRQGHYSLVSRSFKQFLGFFTGIIMVIVGCIFILLKLREEINASSTPNEVWQFTLVTNSPGVVFGILGAILISITATTNDRINVRDAGLYLTREYLVAPFFGEGQSHQNLHDYMRSEGTAPNDSVTEYHPPSTQTNEDTTTNPQN